MSTAIQDLVLIHVSEQPTAYARLEAIDPDSKPGWWRVRFLILTVPLQVVTWILQQEQIDGTPFTMGGTPVRVERVVCPSPPAEKRDDPSPLVPEGEKGKVISLQGRKKTP
jgi:hypothetical protein